MKGWRTVAVNILATIIPILSLTEWVAVLPKEYLPYYALAIALLNVLLRAITDTPMGKSK